MYALLSPVGAGVMFYIYLKAIVRGQRVQWKGRQYRFPLCERRPAPEHPAS